LTIFIAIAIILSVATQSAYSYPTSVDKLVPAKWTRLNFSVCISSNADAKYEKLFIKAMEEWISVWPHFGYTIRENQEHCDINVDITEHPVGLPKERHSHGTTKVTYWRNSHIVSAEITIPTQIKKDAMQGDYCCIELIYEFSEKKFYLIALQEFGHALGLAHAEDDDAEPFDVMSSKGEHPKYVISSVTLKALDSIYGTSTDASDHPIEVKPAVTLEVEMDKDTYAFDDIVRVSGKVSKIGGTGKVMLLRLLEGYPSMSLNTLANFIPNGDGSFALDIDLRTDKSGKWVLLVQYLGASMSMLFDVEETPYKAFGQTDRTSYFIGDMIKVNGNVTRYGDMVSIDVINPVGITFAHKVAPISSDKKFSAEFVLRESKLTIEGEWTLRFGYADSVNALTFNVIKS